MRTAPDVREAVVAVDMMAAAEVTSIKRMRTYAESHPGWNGVPQVVAALGLANEHSRSPNETRMRLVWVLDAGLPRPRVNQPIYDRRGRLLGIADLLDPVAGVVGEYDGADHRRARQHSNDVGREDLFRRHGLEVFRVTGPDLAVTSRIVSRMHGARGRAKWLPADQCAWTIELPAWEEPAPSLDDHLEHREAMTQMYLSLEQEDLPDRPDRWSLHI